MPISFLILTYNSSSYIYSLLDSLIEKVGKEIRDGEYEIVILDNASEDDTLKKIREYFKKKEIKMPQIITSKINLGYAKGINLAAKSSRGEILIVVNPDGKLIKANFKQVISEFKSNTKIAIAGMRLVDSYGISEKTAGKFYNAFTFLLFTIGLEEIFGLRFAPSKFEQVDFVSGGFIAFQKKSFEKLCGYDEDYFMYVEDMDICYRANKMGMQTYYMPFAILEHKGQGSSSRQFAIINIYKGLQTFFMKHSSISFQQYVKNLLTLKAALIIFIGTLFGKRDLVSTYQKAIKTIS